MFRITPNTSDILKMVLHGETKANVKKSISKRFFQRLALGCITTFSLGFITSYLLGPSLTAQDKIFITIPIFLFVGLVTAKLSIDCFSKENEISSMAFDVIDKTISDIGNEFDTLTSRYLIEFISLESKIFDNELVTIKDSNSSQFYSEIRTTILKKYRPNRSPIIPYRSKEYSDYLNLLHHIFRDSKLTNTPFRQVLSAHFNNKDRF